MNERQLLEELVKHLTNYNSPQMLEGYLNGLGDEFNGDLSALGLPTIEQVEQDEE